MERGKSSGRKIWFVCIENSSRSQMAEGFAKARGVAASSAGSMPSSHINPLAIEVMKEKGIDISEAKPKGITEHMLNESDVIVLTDSSLENSIPKKIREKFGKKLVIWSISDPQGQSIEVVRLIRDNIERDLNSLPLEKKIN